MRSLAGEPVQAEARLPRQVRPRRRRRADRDQRADAPGDGLLHQLEPGPAADHQARLAESAPASTRAPVTLSTALCRPTSSRTTRSSPSAVNRPAACTPPVRREDRLALAQPGGQPAYDVR